MKITRILPCVVYSAASLAASAAESPDDVANRKLAAGVEVAAVIPDSISPDGSIAVIFTARKKELKPAVWPAMIRDFSPNTSDAIDNPAYNIENCVVSLREKRRIGAVKSAAKGWAPYWGGSRASLSVLWGPEQEGWYYGLLDYDWGWGCTDLIVLDVDGEAMRETSIHGQLDAAARKLMAAHLKGKGVKLDSFAIGYTLLGVNNPRGSVALLDPLTVRIGLVAQIPKSDVDPIEGTMTVKLARSENGPTTATILGITPGHEDPDPRPEPPAPPPPVSSPAPAAASAGGASLSDFAAFRKEVNAKTETKVWKTVRKELPHSAEGGRHYIKGWFEGKVLQRVMYVDATSDQDEEVTFYYWRGGQLFSVFQVRDGAATRLDGVAECTETYNFVNEKLVAWKHTPSTGDGLLDPTTQGFAEASKRVLADSIKYAAPLYKAIEAD